MKETPPNHDPGSEKRRSARLLHAVPIIVTGTDALGQSFKETTATVMVSCTGCKYQSTHYVPKNSALTIEINRASHPKSRRILQAHVVWVQRPSNYRDRFHIAVEFDVPGNVWGIASPPENWFPHPEDVELEIPVTEPVDLGSFNTGIGAKARPAPYSGAFTSSVETIERPDSTLARGGSQPHMTAATTLVAELPRPVINGEKSAVAVFPKEKPAASPSREITVQSIVKEALAKELGNFRTQLEMQIKEAVAETVKASLDEKASLVIEKILEQSKASISALTEQAEKFGRELTERFDDNIKMAVEAAIAGSAETAATPKVRMPRKNPKRKAKTEVTQEA